MFRKNGMSWCHGWQRMTMFRKSGLSWYATEARNNDVYN
jgi:hypothetical protein